MSGPQQLATNIIDGASVAPAMLAPIITAAAVVPASTNFNPLVAQLAAAYTSGGGSPADLARYNNASSDIDGSGPFPDFTASSNSIEAAANILLTDLGTVVTQIGGAIPTTDAQTIATGLNGQAAVIQSDLQTANLDLNSAATPLADVTSEAGTCATVASTSRSALETASLAYSAAAVASDGIEQYSTSILAPNMPLTAADCNQILSDLEPPAAPFGTVNEDVQLIAQVADEYRNGNGSTIPGLRPLVAAKAGVDPSWPAYTGVDPLTDPILTILDYINSQVI